MAAAKASSLVAVLLVAGYAAALASARTYTVGGVNSWMTGVDYAAWASDKTFVVGDKLLFSYVRGDHTVTEVGKSEYDACSAAGADARSEDNNSGLTTVTLSTPGAHYFICVVPDHCAGGMKLAVNVSATASGASLTVAGAAGGALGFPVAVPVVAAAATGALIRLAQL